MNDHRRTVAVLWIALAASLAASWTHLASLFARHEAPGFWWVGAIMATAVDLGILAAMMAVGEFAARGEATTGPRRTVALLVAMSCLANAAHVWVVGIAGDAAEMVLAVAVAGALPILVWRLSLILDGLRRPQEAPRRAEVAQVALAPARATLGAPTTRKAAHRPAQRATGARERVLAVLPQPGDVSAREIARLAGASDFTVRSLVAAGEIHKNGNGWEKAP